MINYLRHKPAWARPKRSHPCWLALLGILFSLSAPAVSDVDLDRLWLPSSYLRHLPRLYDSARLVQNSSRCVEFIEGTSQLDRSSLERPVFRLTCRDKEGKTYSVLVDGTSLKKLDDTHPDGQISFEQLEQAYQQELAYEREREERERAVQERQQWLDWWQVEHRRREQLWEQCVQMLEDRVGGMQALDWITDTMPEPELAHEPELDDHPPLTFVVDFDAQSYYAEELKYRAYCRQEDEGFNLEVRPRRER